MSKLKLTAIFIVPIITFALGRYTAQKPDVKTVIDQTKNTDIQTDKDTHKQTITKIEKLPDGTQTTTTTTTEDIISKTKQDTQTKLSETQTITQPKSKINISALAGTNIRNFSPVYGISASKEFLGPITIGAFGFTNGLVGLSVGVNF